MITGFQANHGMSPQTARQNTGSDQHLTSASFRTGEEFSYNGEFDPGSG